jgi:hypothetical protein
MNPSPEHRQAHLNSLAYSEERRSRYRTNRDGATRAKEREYWQHRMDMETQEIDHLKQWLGIEDEPTTATDEELLAALGL